MLYHAHSVFVTAELIQILDAVVIKLVQKFNGELLDYLLNKVSGIVMDAQFIEVLPYFVQYQEVLLLIGEEGNELLECMGALLIHHDLRKIRDQYL